MAMWLEGMQNVLRNLNKEIKNIEGRTESGMIRAAIQVRRSMEEVPPTIPVDTGNLRASWFIVTRSTEDGGASSDQAVKQKAQAEVKLYRYPVLIIGFTASYATVVHEDMTAQRQRPGSGPKFLEQALARNQAYILKVIGEEARIK